MLAWIKEYWIETTLVAALVVIFGVVAALSIKNDRLNKSMAGKPRASLVDAFGPPARTTVGGDGAETMEWERHEAGYFHSTFYSDGRGGNYTTTVWIPERNVIRRATVQNGRVTRCEGGF